MRFSIARGISGSDIDDALPKRYSGVADAATRRRRGLTLLSFPDNHVVTSSDAARALKRLGGKADELVAFMATRQLKHSPHSETPVLVHSRCDRSAGLMSGMPPFVRHGRTSEIAAQVVFQSRSPGGAAQQTVAADERLRGPVEGQFMPLSRGPRPRLLAAVVRSNATVGVHR